MINFNYNNNIQELVEIILEEHFGKEVTTVGMSLLSNGPSSIPEIKKSLSFDFTKVRNALIILMQNKFVIYQEVKRREIIENVYEFDIETALNYLRFPKILYMISQKFDKNALSIFEEFMQFGVLSANQIIEQVTFKQCQETKLNPSQLNNIKIRFMTLIEEGFITQCNKTKTTELKTDKTESKKKTKKEERLTSSAKKRKNQMIIDEEDFTESKSLANKVIDDDNALIYNKDKNKYFYFYMNFDKIIADLKVEIIVDYIRQKLKGQAAMIAAIMLKRDSIHAFREGKSSPMTVEEVVKQMSLGSNTNSKEKIKTVKEILEMMSREEYNYVLSWGVSDGSDTYCINLECIAENLKVQTLEKIVEQHFGPDHVRIYRLLSKCGPLDSKNIMEITLMPYKESSACLNQMIDEGFLEIQPVTLKGPVSFFCVNNKRNNELTIAKIYKIIKNLKSALKSTLVKNKNTESQSKLEQYITKVYGTISELDDSILVLKYF